MTSVATSHAGDSHTYPSWSLGNSWIDASRIRDVDLSYGARDSAPFMAMVIQRIAGREAADRQGARSGAWKRAALLSSRSTPERSGKPSRVGDAFTIVGTVAASAARATASRREKVAAVPSAAMSTTANETGGSTAPDVDARSS